jgi:hypothetical protein
VNTALVQAKSEKIKIFAATDCIEMVSFLIDLQFIQKLERISGKLGNSSYGSARPLNCYGHN